MSHVAGVQVRVKNLGALKRACDKLGTVEFVEGQTRYKWWNRHVGDYPIPKGYTEADLGKCDHVIRVKGNRNAYEIGVVKRKDGDGFDFLYDFYGSQGKAIVDALGGDYKKVRTQPGTAFDGIMQEYGLQVAEEAAQEHVAAGWQLERVAQPNGDITLRLYK